MNTPYQPGDSAQGVPPHDAPADGHDPLAGNPYSAQYRQAPAPDLDAAAPQLRASDVRRMNLRALGFLAGIVALLLVVAFWLLKSATGSGDAPAKPREETVTVPEAPQPQPVPLPRPAPRQPEPIPLAAPPPLPTAAQTRPMSMPRGPRGPSLMERRMMTGEAAAQSVGNGQYAPGAPGGAGMPGPYGQMPGFPGAPDPGAIPANSAYAAKPLSEVSTAQPLANPDTLMLRGTYIRCVLETHIVTDIPGFTSCIVTEPVYSFNGKRLLLPKGSKVLGQYSMEPNGPRVAVIWDRIVTPTGIDVNMSSPGVDNLGGAGHPGYYTAHWGSRIGAALLISLLSDAFKYEAAEHGPRNTTISNGVVTQTPYESNTAQTMQNLANQAVRRAANRPATVTINQGTVLNVYVAKDVDFSGVVARY